MKAAQLLQFDLQTKIFRVKTITVWMGCVLCALNSGTPLDAKTTALWLFDEPLALYPSSVLDSSSANDYPLVIGQGGRLMTGKFGNALEIVDRPPIDYPTGLKSFGLQSLAADSPSSINHMSWENARFAALMTSG
jgi:hypothetical protein